MVTELNSHLHVVHAHDVPTVVHVLLQIFILQGDGWLTLEQLQHSQHLLIRFQILLELL